MSLKPLVWNIGKVIYALAAGLVCDYWLLAYAGSFIAAGHGTTAIMQLAWGPLGLGFCFWPTAFVLAAFAEVRPLRSALAMVLLAHYALLLIQLVKVNIAAFVATFNGPGERATQILVVASYVLIHVGLWARFAVFLHHRPTRVEQGAETCTQ